MTPDGWKIEVYKKFKIKTMKRMLSSRATFLWKVVFPLLWSAAFGFTTLWLFLNTVDSSGKPIPVWMKWQFLVMWLLGTFFLWWIVALLKRVFRDEGSLYVSNYQTEIAIPFANIAKVRENRHLHIGGKHPVIVDLVAPTLLGRRIVFIPTGKAPFAWPWQKKPHPIMTELQEITRENQG